MKKFMLGTVLVAAGVVGAVAWTYDADAQGGKRKKKWTMIDVGDVPSEFGDLVSFTGSAGNYAFVFKNDEGTLHIIDYRGNKLPPKAFVVKRSYE